MIPWPEDRWQPPEVALHLTGGPGRIYDSDPTEHTPRPVGFVVPKPVRHVKRRVKFKPKEDA